ncbi:ATP-binding protein [Streptomyces sp. DSM 44917]|uniref:histidine kinase n=1 Tax=Streptomyces boetiae TaxID=3075541 RepID=A0ABU2LCB9_9ACTN|nr:ATP-binding protein [Streptomyces sp. DSM 44917]MDT0309228.1 ATP-binding protein [Streptomyces sp. DSM 44917]
MTAVTAARKRQLTTRRWLSAGACAWLAALALLVALGGWAQARTDDATNDLVAVGSPALISAIRLERALIDQETGIRGYALSGDPGSLAPYTQGLAQERAESARLAELIAGDGQAEEDLRRVLAEAETWRERVAEPVASADPDALAEDGRAEGRAEFDAVREATAGQQAHIEETRTEAREELDAAERVRTGVFAVAAALVVALILLAFTGLRRGITLPLERLRDDARTVADGAFGHPIEGTGPADLRQLAEDVEQMRRRLADELAFTQEARGRLDEQAEELRRSNEELEQFAYVASHDLQEPLRKVASFCQLLQRRYGGQLDDRADQYIAFAVDGANRMQTLINDLLQYSRVGRLNGQETVVDLQETLTRTLDALSVTVEESGAEVTSDPLPPVRGDATQMGMLMQNLISNAIKFRVPDRPPRIHVSARRDADTWHFAVADNGIGIDAEYAERVFVIFQRLHTKDLYPGNGIGLAMCKKIVESRGGTIGIDPAHHPGTRIVFTLPAEPDEAGGEGEAPLDDPAGAGAAEGGTARSADEADDRNGGNEGAEAPAAEPRAADPPRGAGGAGSACPGPRETDGGADSARSSGHGAKGGRA